jgi:hypothetical protein
MRLRIAPIVEGHGEQYAIRTLLTRVWTELLGGEFLDVLRPIRGKRHQLVRPEDLERAIGLAALNLAERPSEDRALILLLLDADDDLPCSLAPSLLEAASACRADLDVACVIANVEYETWFVGAAASLTKYLETRGGREDIQPERLRLGKGWVRERFIGPARYSETLDQPRLTAEMDLRMCRAACPSFDKLCRVLEARMAPTASPPSPAPRSAGRPS